MNTFLTQDRYADILGLSTGVPQTSLLPGETINLQVFQLVQDQVFYLHWLNFYVVSTSSNTGTKINESLGLFYVGIFRSQQPSGTPIIQVGVDTSNLVQVIGAEIESTNYYRAIVYLNPYYPVKIRTPGTYAMSLVNNTRELTASILVNSSSLIYLP